MVLSAVSRLSGHLEHSVSLCISVMSQQDADQDAGPSSVTTGTLRTGRTINSTIQDLLSANVIPENHTGAIYVIDSTTSYFSKAVVMMSKIGDNLYLVPSSEGLYVKGLNNARTVVGGFLFRTNYFCYSDTSRLDASRSANMCRLSVKSAVATFHNIGERKPCSSLVLFLDPKGDTMKVIFYVNCDVVKTHELRLRETTTTFKSLFDDNEKHLMPNMIRCPPTHFTKILGSHISYFDTIIDCRIDNKIYFRRFLPPEDGERPQIMKREGYIAAEDMLKYKMTLKSEVSVSTKEFLSMILFADSVGITLIDLLIAEPGKPLIISMTETPDEFSAEFHISTMDGEMNDLIASSLNCSNCSFSVSQVVNNSRVPFVPVSRKRKSPIVAVVPVEVSDEAAPSRERRDSFEDEDADREIVASMAEMSERKVEIGGDGCISPDMPVSRKRRSSPVPMMPLDPPEGTSQEPRNSFDNEDEDLQLLATMAEMSGQKMEQQDEGEFFPDSPPPPPSRGRPTPHQHHSSVQNEEQNIEPEPASVDNVEEDDDDEIFPGSPSPTPPPVFEGISTSHRHRNPMEDEEVDSDRTDPLSEEDQDGEVFPRSPSPPPHPARRRNFLNTSQATFYGTQTEGKVLACRTPQTSQNSSSRN
ncbi:hypothetical protein QR680_014944 [Steinernema hermaphroditum]|uniref:Cell cycle checkpoint control protein n=1 Tax=Steinernema hermaphroditum TaxID=289476 RepID=A0AA39ID59_9BILA|nr:hypothetical protein QR680_014944 [Steinernema hermaphroditum]